MASCGLQVISFLKSQGSVLPITFIQHILLGNVSITAQLSKFVVLKQTKETRCYHGDPYTIIPHVQELEEKLKNPAVILFNWQCTHLSTLAETHRTINQLLGFCKLETQTFKNQREAPLEPNIKAHSVYILMKGNLRQGICDVVATNGGFILMCPCRQAYIGSSKGLLKSLVHRP